MEGEVKGDTCEHKRMLNLQAWSTLAHMSEQLCRKVWEAVLRTSEQIPTLFLAAANAIPSYSNRNKCKSGASAEDDERWWPLLVDTRHYCPDLEETFWPLSWFPEDTRSPPATAYEMAPFYIARTMAFQCFGTLAWLVRVKLDAVQFRGMRPMSRIKDLKTICVVSVNELFGIGCNMTEQFLGSPPQRS